MPSSNHHWFDHDDSRLTAYINTITAAAIKEREQGMPRWYLTTPAHLVDSPQLCAERRRVLLAAVHSPADEPAGKDT